MLSTPASVTGLDHRQPVVVGVRVACPDRGCLDVATVVDTSVLNSTSGPVVHARVSCPAHHFVVPTDWLHGAPTWQPATGDTTTLP